MEYVGWRDIKSAMLYLKTSHAGIQSRFKANLHIHSSSSTTKVADTPAPVPAVPTYAPTATPLALQHVALSLSLLAKVVGSIKRCLRLIVCRELLHFRLTLLSLQGRHHWPGRAAESRVSLL